MKWRGFGRATHCASIVHVRESLLRKAAAEVT
jgi:hypothetical protein